MLEFLSQLTWSDVWDYAMDQMKNNQFFATAGVFGILGILWNYTRKYPEWIWIRIKRKITYTVNVYETDSFFDYLEKYLKETRAKSYRNVEIKSYWKGDKQFYKTHQFEDLFFIWKGIRLIKVYKNREKLENANSIETLFMNSYQITGIFAKRAIRKIVQEVFDMEMERRVNEVDPSVHIYTNDSHSWIRHNNIVPKELDRIVLDNKEELISDIDNFVASRDWYVKRNISYKRGYMLYGAPGNGKTTLCMSLAKYLKRDLYMLTPTRMTDDDDLMGLFRHLSPKSILLIEDIDAVYGVDRESDNDEVRFSFSTLLNCLDGALSKQDVIVMFTTNYPENLDSALIREGRIDFKMEVGNPRKEQAEEYLRIFYEDDTIRMLDYDGRLPLSMVEIQNICLRNRDDANKALNEILTKVNSYEEEV